MKWLLPLLFASSLNAAVIIQETNNDISTTISFDNGQYTYRYDVLSPTISDWSELGIYPIDRVFSLWMEDANGEVVYNYTQTVPISGSYTIEFQSAYAPTEGRIDTRFNFFMEDGHSNGNGNGHFEHGNGNGYGHVHLLGQSGMHMDGWIPSGNTPNVPEPSIALLSVVGFMFLLKRRK
jgi:hypothetical protein